MPDRAQARRSCQHFGGLAESGMDRVQIASIKNGRSPRPARSVRPDSAATDGQWLLDQDDLPAARQVRAEEDDHCGPRRHTPRRRPDRRPAPRRTRSPGEAMPAANPGRLVQAPRTAATSGGFIGKQREIGARTSTRYVRWRGCPSARDQSRPHPTTLQLTRGTSSESGISGYLRRWRSVGDSTSIDVESRRDE